MKYSESFEGKKKRQMQFLSTGLKTFYLWQQKKVKGEGLPGQTL